MKKTLLFLITVFLFINYITAQKMNRQKINMLKTYYITDAINLTPKEAEKFWPVYNLYSDNIQNSRISLEGGLIREVLSKGGIDNVTDIQAEKYVAKLLQLEQDISSNKIKMIKELSKIISAKKILKLQKAERDFNRRILQEYGKRKRMQGQ
jgi:hypothetical protein